MIRFAALLIAFLPNIPFAAEPADPLFANQEPLALQLNGPFERIDNERDKEQEYEGSISYVNENGDTVTLDAEFSVRGNWRLQKQNCAYSQLWVNLKRGQVPGTLFENQNRLKLVVQCRRQDRYGDLIQKEYLAYKLFEELSDIHFDTRLVDATYQDSEEGDTRSHRAFFIEHQNRIADRFGLEEVEDNTVAIDSLDAEQATRTALFMFMLGNTDFSLRSGPEGEECCHNAKLFRSAGGKLFPVPYDFDASGFVDAPYAPDPAPSLGISSNKRRVYRGYCAHQATVPGIVAEARQSQQASLALFDAAGLEGRAARSTRNFLLDFYELLEDEEDVEDDIVQQCRG